MDQKLMPKDTKRADSPQMNSHSPKYTSLKILPSNVEGDCILSEVYLLQMTWKQIFQTLLGTLFSGGILLILMHWSFRLRLRLLYTRTSSLESSTHLLIVNADSTRNIQRLSQISTEHQAYLQSEYDFQKEQQSSTTNNRQKQDIEQQTSQNQYKKQQHAFQDEEDEVTMNNINGQYSAMNQPSQAEESSEQSQQENLSSIQDSSRSTIRSFMHRELSYFISNRTVSAMECQLTNANARLANQLSPEEVNLQRKLFGKCATHVKIPSVFEYMLVQMTTPFYFLQYASCVLWVFEDYASFSITVLSCSFGITLINYVLMRVQKVKVASLIPKSEKVNILRRAGNSIRLRGSAGNLKEEYEAEDIIAAGSDEIVIGDVIVLKAPMKLPCDCVLIEGQALLNEVSLTGESLPAHKYSMNGQEFDANQDPLLFSYSTNLKHLLCEGTEIIQCTPGAKAKALRIGYCSFRGQILRSMLYPKLNVSDYYPNSLKLMAVLLIPVMATYCARIPMMYELDFPGQFYFYRFFDALTWLIPPFLPIFLNLSSSLALIRLQTANVIGLDGQKIVEAGSVTEMCFDKTGTLTVATLNASGVFSASNSQQKHIDENGNCNELSSLERLCFATCHSVKLLEGTDDFIGDPLDIAMLGLSKYTLSDWNTKSTSQDHPIQFKATDRSSSNSVANFVDVLKIFDFSPELSRSACIIQTSNGEYMLIVKGAPEVLKNMCSKGVSDDIDECVKSECEKGQRVIAFATKSIGAGEVNARREELECDMEYQCLLSFSNNLKPDSAEVIQRLSQGAVNCRVISGDNLTTTVATCRLAGIIDGEEQTRKEGKNQQNKSQKLGLIEQNEEGLRSQYIPAVVLIEYTHNDNTMTITKNSASLQGQQQQPIIHQGRNDSEINQILRNLLKDTSSTASTTPLSMQFGITGSTLSRLLDSVESSAIQQERNELLKQLLTQTKVFARMRPEQKRTIIQLLQSYGYKVGMIGDGANDCAAIKQGDIGISFAAADAALSAPFSSRGESIVCVEKILLEGRCSKQINVEILLVMVAENLIKYIGVMVLLQEASNYASFQYSYLAYMCSMTLLVLLALSRPVKILSRSLPSHRFYSLKYLLSIHSQILIFAVSFITAYMILCQQNWHVAYTKLAESDGSYSYNMHGQANTIVFLLSSVFYVSSMITFYQSSPFKEGIHRNYLLLLWVISYFGMAIALAFKPGFFGALSLDESLEEHELFMFGIIVIPFAATVVMLVAERVIRKYFK